jgi:hypothetical protein
MCINIWLITYLFLHINVRLKVDDLFFPYLIIEKLTKVKKCLGFSSKP